MAFFNLTDIIPIEIGAIGSRVRNKVTFFVGTNESPWYLLDVFERLEVDYSPFKMSVFIRIEMNRCTDMRNVAVLEGDSDDPDAEYHTWFKVRKERYPAEWQAVLEVCWQILRENA